MMRTSTAAAPHPRGRIRSGRSPGRGSAGIVLIEALVAILIFAFGVLGIVGLQAAMVKAQSASKFRGDAAYLADGILGAMWSDDITTNLSKYTTANCAAYAPCKAWKSKVAATLPGGGTAIAVDGSNNVTVTVSWTIPDEGTHSYSTSGSLQP
jgi:type IV pilus assembly protein PilV